MEGFSKVFKNLIYVIENGKLLRAIKWGHSVRIGDEIIEIYREEGEIDPTESRSKGRLKRVRYRGKPNVEEIYRLIGVENDGRRIPFLRRTELHLKSNTFGVVTERVGFRELIFEKDSGRVLERDIILGGEREVGRLKPVRDLKGFFELVPDIWRTVDEYEFVSLTQRSRRV